MVGLLNGGPQSREPMARGGAPAAPAMAEEERPALGEETGDQPNVSPEEQAQYDRFVANGMKLIFSETAVPAILNLIKAGDSPSEGLAAATVQVVSRLKDSAERGGMKISNDVLIHGGTELMGNIAELSEAAKAHAFSPEEIEQAGYLAMDMYGTQEMERGTLDKDAIARDFQTMLEADRAGKVDEILPGLSEKARQIQGVSKGKE